MSDSPYVPKTWLRHLSKKLKTWLSCRTFCTRIERFTDANPRILDAGCGAGYLARGVEAAFPDAFILAGDLEKEHLKYSKKQVVQADLIQFDVQFLPLRGQEFDVVISSQVVEHLRSPQFFISECARVLSDGGILVLSTPNPEGIAAKALGNKWQGNSSHHVSLFSPQQWRRLLISNGFHILEDGTTGITGFEALRIPPLGLINFIPMSIFGFFPWYWGESYIAVARKH